jgi:hypothetical protein
MRDRLQSELIYTNIENEQASENTNFALLDRRGFGQNRA